MPAKCKGPWFFTELQAKKYDRTIRRLSNLEGDAFCELRKVGRWNLTNKRYSDAGIFLAKVAAQMTSALQDLVAILHSAQQPSRTLVQFVYAPVCGDCMASPYGREDHSGVEAPPPLDPAHYGELEELLEFVNQISERLWSSRTRRKTLPVELTRGLTCLANVLVKLLRHFRETAPGLRTRLESDVYDGDDCSRCHGPLTTPAEERPARERNEIE